VSFNVGLFRSSRRNLPGTGKVDQVRWIADRLPVGEGLFSFRNMEEAVTAFREIESDYPRHGRGARCIAEEYFRAEPVLNKLLEDAGI
jgi:hypothetical protein